MSSNWISHIYPEDAVIPVVGELINFRYRFGSIDFPHGSASEGTMGTNPSVARRQKKMPFHHALVSSVLVTQAGDLLVVFFPVVSYSNPPPGFIGTDWDAAAWMLAQPPQTTFRPLPIPATGWSPAPPTLWGTSPLNFGRWTNDRPAWLTIHAAHRTIPGSDEVSSLRPILLSSWDTDEDLVETPIPDRASHAS